MQTFDRTSANEMATWTEVLKLLLHNMKYLHDVMCTKMPLTDVQDAECETYNVEDEQAKLFDQIEAELKRSVEEELLNVTQALEAAGGDGNKVDIKIAVEEAMEEAATVSDDDVGGAEPTVDVAMLQMSLVESTIDETVMDEAADSNDATIVKTEVENFDDDDNEHSDDKHTDDENAFEDASDEDLQTSVHNG